jgi:hypothetical protein
MRVFGRLPPGVRAVVLVSATSLFMVMVAWATLIGPDEVFTGPGRFEHSPTQAAETCVPLEVVTTHPDGTTETVAPDNPRNLPVCEEAGASTGEAPPPSRAGTPVWLKVLTWTFVFAILATILALVVFLAVLARDQLRRRSRDRQGREHVDFASLAEPARLAAAIAEDAAAQDALLRDGDARNAIVAAWQRFEVQGERAGVGRHTWETSSEYALRILDVVAADSGAVNRLAGLYREARFSEHPITEDHRAAALDALAQVRSSMQVPA